jgi:hypothetical protein
MTKRVAAALRDQREKGRATSQDGPGTYQLWKWRVRNRETPTYVGG